MMSCRPFHTVPVIFEIAAFLEQEMTYEEGPMAFNHIIGTRYRDAADNIGWHADKMQDIRENTPIVMLSLGETRELQLGVPCGDDGRQTRLTHAIPFGHGDLFVLGPRTNAEMRHRIATVAEETVIGRRAGAMVKPRVSLVFRDIETRITLDEVRALAQHRQRERDRRRQQARSSQREPHDHVVE